LKNGENFKENIFNKRHKNEEGIMGKNDSKKFQL